MGAANVACTISLSTHQHVMHITCQSSSVLVWRPRYLPCKNTCDFAVLSSCGAVLSSCALSSALQAGSIEPPGSPSSTVDGSSHSRPHRSISHLTGQSLLRNMPTEGLASSLVSNRPPQLPKSASFMQVRPTTR